MPVRSLNSSILKWPDKRTVHEAAQVWADKHGTKHANVLAIGYFGSYARGNWGVGSDLDLIIILKNSDSRFEKRPLEWDFTRLPVPAEAIVYTLAEWQLLLSRKNRFAENLAGETVWLYSHTNDLRKRQKRGQTPL